MSERAVAGRRSSSACMKDLRFSSPVSVSWWACSTTCSWKRLTTPNSARSTAAAPSSGSGFNSPRRRYIATCCKVRVDTLAPRGSTNTYGLN
ncbi:MAG: hypothetical protein ACK56I_09525, partial [bacterium]